MKNIYSVPTNFVNVILSNTLASGQLTIGQLDAIGDMYRNAFRMAIIELRGCLRLNLSNQLSDEQQKTILSHHQDLVNLLLSKYDYNVQLFINVMKDAKPLPTLNHLGLSTYMLNLARLIDGERKNNWKFWIRKDIQLMNTRKILASQGIID